jgi:nitrogen regulatory protein P-II 1
LGVSFGAAASQRCDWTQGATDGRVFGHLDNHAVAPRRDTPARQPQGSRERVKLVIGIVRPEKANDVLEALYRAEVRGISISRVQGHGGELDRVETYRGTTVKMALADKVRFEIAVSEPFVEPTIEALCEGGRTGEVGDGKIFVVPLERVVRIRTGQTDVSAVTPVRA